MMIFYALTKAKLTKNIFRGNWRGEYCDILCRMHYRIVEFELGSANFLEVHDCMDDRLGHICIRHKLTLLVEANNLFEC